MPFSAGHPRSILLLPSPTRPFSFVVGGPPAVIQKAQHVGVGLRGNLPPEGECADRKSTRLNSSHLGISYAVFCWAPPQHSSPPFPHPPLFLCGWGPPRRNSKSSARRRWSARKPSTRRRVCRSEEHTSELQSLRHLVCRFLLGTPAAFFSSLPPPAPFPLWLGPPPP